LASLGLNLEEQKAVDRFRKDVVEPSMTKLVILDFWAEWCGPCKQLTPVLEKVAAEYADKGVVLAKVNVDEEQFIAAQFQVRSIPTVYAMFQGQPVADLTGARTESQLKQYLDQILAKVPVQAGDEPAQDITPARHGRRGAGRRRRRSRGGHLRPDHRDRARQRARAFRPDPRAAAGRPQGRGGRSAGRARSQAGGRSRAGAGRSALALAEDAPEAGELAGLRAAAEADPADMDAQLAYANALYAGGDRDAAAATLLRMIAADREWNEGAARARLLQIFEAIGLEDPWVAATRRKLSTVLFG
jgi:putative thioredoxin